MKFTMEQYTAGIEVGQKRGRAESAMQTFLGETDLRKVDRRNLEVFLEDVLPRLIPDTLGGEADEWK